MIGDLTNSMEIEARMIFLGHFVPAHFADFVRHRAARLALRLGTVEISATRAAIVVAGQVDLVDAFEMACSLGPRDGLVLEVFRESAQGTARGTGEFGGAA